MHAGPAHGGWQPVCRLEDLRVGQGAVALVQGQAVAVFRVAGDEVYAVGNHDPFLHEGAVSRGIVGVRDGVPFVGSARHRHVFDLRTGRCLDDDHVGLPSYGVQVRGGVVQVGRRRSAADGPLSVPARRRPGPSAGR